MRRFLFLLASCIASLAAHAQINYGLQAYPSQGAFIAQRTAGGGNPTIVGAQLNSWGYAGTAPIFGAAVESVNYTPAASVQVSLENAVVNTNPANFSRKIGNNAVFKCRMDGAPGDCAVTPNNFDAIAYWVSAQPGTGFESALKLDVHSIADSPHRHAAVIDLEDLDPSKDYVLIRLPGGREVRVSEFVRALDNIH